MVILSPIKRIISSLKTKIKLYYEGMLISPQPDLLPDVVERNRQCRWKEGSVHVPNFKTFLVTEAERKHVRRSARFQQHRDASCHQAVLQGKMPKEIHAILKETLGEHGHRMTQSNTGWPSLNVVMFPPPSIKFKKSSSIRCNCWR